MTSSATTTAPITSYAWDFEGTGANDVTCYSHSNVAASYQQTGLYLTKVTITDSTGNAYTDSAIVNVVDYSTMNDRFTQKWNSMKTALANGDITGALTHYADDARQVFTQRFSEPDTLVSLPDIVAAWGQFRLVKITESTAECELRIDKDGEAYSFQVLLIRNLDGSWGILSY